MAANQKLGIEFSNNQIRWVLLELQNSKKIAIKDHGIFDNNINYDNRLDNITNKISVSQKKIFHKIPVIISLANDTFKKIDYDFLKDNSSITQDYQVNKIENNKLIAIPKKLVKFFIKYFHNRPFYLHWLQCYQQTIDNSLVFLLPKISLFAATNSVIIICIANTIINIDFFHNHVCKASQYFYSSENDTKNIFDYITQICEQYQVTINLVIVIGTRNIFSGFNKLENIKIIYLEDLFTQYFCNYDIKAHQPIAIAALSCLSSFFS